MGTSRRYRLEQPGEIGIALWGVTVGVLTLVSILSGLRLFGLSCGVFWSPHRLVAGCAVMMIAGGVLVLVGRARGLFDDMRRAIHVEMPGWTLLGVAGAVWCVLAWGADRGAVIFLVWGVLVAGVAGVRVFGLVVEERELETVAALRRANEEQGVSRIGGRCVG